MHEGLALNLRRACTPTPREMQNKTLTAFVTVIEEPAHNWRRNSIIAYGVGTPYGLLLSLMPQPFPLENCGGTQVVLPVDPLSQQTTRRDVLDLSAGGSVIELWASSSSSSFGVLWRLANKRYVHSRHLLGRRTT